MSIERQPDHHDEDETVASAADLPTGLGASEAVRLLETMLRIRRFEEAALEEYKSANIPGALHVSIGQEACSTGAAAALAPHDLVIGTHRSHGDVIARGGDVGRMMAELFGKVTGYCQGKGGSMHILDADLGVLGANGIVAAGLPIAVGASLGSQMQGKDTVVLAFIGDGAVAKGNFHEALTLATMWQTPTIIFCQNNHYAVSMDIRRVYPQTTLADLARSYGVPTHEVDGNDVLAVFSVTREAAARARAGGGPSVIVANTYRRLGHNVSDPGTYRPEGEQAHWRDRDPVARLFQVLEASGTLGQDQLRALEAAVDEEIGAARSFAAASEAPEAAAAFTDVLSPGFRIIEGRVALAAVPGAGPSTSREDTP